MTETLCTQANARQHGTVKRKFGSIVPTTGGWRVGFNSRAPHDLAMLGICRYHRTLEGARAWYERMIQTGPR